MAINQAIFTSSARGIEKGGGFGIHTYNRDCSDLELTEFRQSFCEYSYAGESNKISELPKKMLYKKIANERYMQALVTYLGKDYDKERGRMGNFLSHMYSFEREDIKVYPMQLYGSFDYRYFMEEHEVDGSSPVEYLSDAKTVHPGSKITIDTIQDFLSCEAWKMEFFCHMIAAVLSRDAVHKVIIYDTHENIIMWLAAVEYALPLQCAKEISFSSYENDPTISEFDIRGAVVGLSRGTIEEYEDGGQFFVFDGITQKYPKFDISEDYYQYGIQMGMAFAYDSIQAFHEFVTKYNYEKADKDICFAYKLHQMVQNGMEMLDEKEFQQAITFESKYGDNLSYRRMLNNIFEKLENSEQPEEKLLKKVYILLIAYFNKELNEEEWESAISCAIYLEQYVENNLELLEDNEQLWNTILGLAMRKKECLMLLIKKLKKFEEYQHLGELSAWIVRKIKTETPEKYVKQLFDEVWKDVPCEEYLHFDLAVQVAVDRIKLCENVEMYSKALEMFLILQNSGKGEISGRGMERLLRIIDHETNLSDIKGQKSGLLHRKKEENKELENLQARCAFEAFNYNQRYNRNIPIAKIRLLHLGRCITKAYEEEICLEKSKTLSIYSKYPVVIEEISDEEFKSYIQVLCNAIYSMENEKENYIQLLTYWILNKSQKKIIIELFLANELTRLKKEEQIEGLAALLTAVRILKDEEYIDALVNTVVEIKASHREKIAIILGEELGKSNKLYRFWKEIENETMEIVKNSKRKFPKFGKH